MALAVAAKSVSVASHGEVSAILCAIVFGILWRNLAGLGAWAEPGLEFAGQTLLRIGIALIGLRLTLAVLADVSLMAVPIVVACIAVALIAAIGLGRLFGVAPGIRRLLAAGTAICGCTAIIAVAPLLRVRQSEVGIAIACIVLFGSAAMVGYPWLAHAVFGSDIAAAGMFFGASVQDTSQVVGASMIYADQFNAPDTVAIAGLTKFLRTFGLLLLVPATAMWMARSEARRRRRKAVGTSATRGALVRDRVHGARRRADDGRCLARRRALEGIPGHRAAVSEMLLLCGMAAVGLGITFAHLREAGWRPLAVAFLAASLTGTTALVLLSAI